jgi:hypothetical protein
MSSSMVGPAAGSGLARCYLLTNPTNHELVRSLEISGQGQGELSVKLNKAATIRC